VQQCAVQKLQTLYLQLIARNNNLGSKILSFFGKNKSIKGIYFWGGVGRGKTYIMDLFCQSLDQKIKVRRIHFHRFMYWVHQQLKEHKGEQNPLKAVALKLASEVQVLCFDEFFVNEIGNAMLLGRLFDTLFTANVVLVTTSNIPPQKLYWKGLHRDRFLDTIRLLEQHTEVIEMDGGTDYRLRALKQVEVYHFPLEQAAHENLQKSFQNLTGGESLDISSIYIQGREIQVEAVAPKVLWCSFKALCEGPRAAADYIELSRIYPTILLAEIPKLDDSKIEATRRFVTLIDELYEHNVKLIISAENSIEQLYSDEKLSFEFKRTISRLQEMQSEDYLAREHLP
jgi:cell division protein ZapE